MHMKKTLRGWGMALAISVASVAVLSSAQAADKPHFRIAWTIYAGWIPWDYVKTSGIMDKWADKYGIDVEIVQINDYIESINQFTTGQFDGVVATSMDALSIPAASGVDTTALIVGDYSNGNDGIVAKDATRIAELKGTKINLVQLSVSHYLLARALEENGMSERDVDLVNTSDADIVAAYTGSDVRTVVTWNPLLSTVASMPGSHELFDSSQIPGHIKDLTLVNTKTLKKHPELGKALVGAWYEMMAQLGADTDQGRKVRAYLGEASGTDREGYEAQLAGMKMFWTPQDSIDFISSDEAFAAMDSVRQFSFEKGLLGEGADSADFVGIAFPGDRVLGNENNVNLRFDTTYMQMAADDAL